MGKYMKFVAVALLVVVFPLDAVSKDWPMFRGPNGSGVATAVNLPVEFSPEKNLAWKTLLPPGHSSPVLGETSIFLTGWEGNSLSTFSIDRTNGKILGGAISSEPTGGNYTTITALPHRVQLQTVRTCMSSSKISASCPTVRMGMSGGGFP